MAADAAGVRFATALLGAPRAAWPGIVDALESEADLMPALDGLPEGMDEAGFRARYGSVDSPAYAAVVAEITQRIDALPLYAPLRTQLSPPGVNDLILTLLVAIPFPYQFHTHSISKEIA